MKKSVLYFMLAACLMLTSYVQGQKFAIGLRAGLSIPNLSSGGSDETPVNSGYSSRLGTDLALFGEYKISKVLSLQPMLQYSSQGGKKDGLQAFTTPDQIAAMFPPGQAPPYLYANYKSKAKLNYLLIPILAKLGWDIKNSNMRFYVDFGTFAGFLLSAKQVTKGNSEIYADASAQQPLPGGSQSFDNTEDIKDQLHTFNFGVEGNLGLSYLSGPGYLFAEIGANYGFLNIQKGSANGKNHTGAATITFGYAFLLGNSR